MFGLALGINERGNAIINVMKWSENAHFVCLDVSKEKMSNLFLRL